MDEKPGESFSPETPLALGSNGKCFSGLTSLDGKNCLKTREIREKNKFKKYIRREELTNWGDLVLSDENETVSYSI